MWAILAYLAVNSEPFWYKLWLWWAVTDVIVVVIAYYGVKYRGEQLAFPEPLPPNYITPMFRQLIVFGFMTYFAFHSCFLLAILIAILIVVEALLSNLMVKFGIIKN